MKRKLFAVFGGINKIEIYMYNCGMFANTTKYNKDGIKITLLYMTLLTKHPK